MTRPAKNLGEIAETRDTFGSQPTKSNQIFVCQDILGVAWLNAKIWLPLKTGGPAICPSIHACDLSFVNYHWVPLKTINWCVH